MCPTTVCNSDWGWEVIYEHSWQFAGSVLEFAAVAVFKQLWFYTITHSNTFIYQQFQLCTIQISIKCTFTLFVIEIRACTLYNKVYWKNNGELCTIGHVTSVYILGNDTHHFLKSFSQLFSYVCACACVYIHVEIRGQSRVPFLRMSILCFEAGSLTNPELADLARLADEQGSRILLSWPPQC